VCVASVLFFHAPFAAQPPLRPMSLVVFHHLHAEGDLTGGRMSGISFKEDDDFVVVDFKAKPCEAALVAEDEGTALPTRMRVRVDSATRRQRRQQAVCRCCTPFSLCSCAVVKAYEPAVFLKKTKKTSIPRDAPDLSFPPSWCVAGNRQVVQHSRAGD
jgi:hypothetical protein